MTMRSPIVALPMLVLACALAGRPAAGADSTADPAANRKASGQYDDGLRSNPGFRSNREHQECDPIESLDLRARCYASFDEPAPKPEPETAPPLDLEHPTVTITTRPVRSPGDE